MAHQNLRLLTVETDSRRIADMVLTRTEPSGEDLAEFRSPDAGRLSGFDHLELWVGNARASAQLLESGFGFDCVAYAGPETGVPGRVSYLLEQGTIRFVVTAGLTSDSPVCRHVLRHGDGVRTVAFATSDVGSVFGAAVDQGATVVEEPHAVEDRRGVIRTARITAYGETEHTFVDRSDYGGLFLPGFEALRLPTFGLGKPAGLAAFDHVVGNVEEGRLDEWVAWYEKVLGFSEMMHFDADQIRLSSRRCDRRSSGTAGPSACL